MRCAHFVLVACVGCSFPEPSDLPADAALDADVALDAGTPPAPDAAPMDFSIALASSRIHLVEDGQVQVPVVLGRNSFSAPVVVAVTGLPAGVTADPLTIAGDSGELILHAAADATQGDASLTITASAESRSHEVPLSLLMMGRSGAQDRSFSLRGPLVSNLRAWPFELLIQPDGKIVIAGWFNSDEKTMSFVARFLPDGAPDPEFSGGMTILDPNAFSQATSAVALQPDGKIVVAGYGSDGTRSSDGMAMRVNSDGSIDNDFGDHGLALFGLSEPGADTSTKFNSIAVQPDGGIVVAGSTSGFSGGASTGLAVVARLTPAGTLDTSFGTDGRTTTSFGRAGSEFLDLAIQPDGRIVAIGTARVALAGQQGGRSVAAFARFRKDGRPDTSFNGTGTLTMDLGTLSVSETEFGGGAAVALQPDGKIVVAGGASADNPRQGHWGSDACLVRLNGDDGTPDTGFGTNGVKIVSIGAGNDDQITGVALQPDGKFVIAGFTHNEESRFYDAFVARFSTDSLLDLSFASSGALPNAVENQRFEGVAIDADGRIVATGAGALLARFWP